MLLKREQVDLEVPVAANGHVGHVQHAEIQTNARTEDGRPQVRHLQRIAADFQTLQSAVEGGEQCRIKTLHPIVRQIQIGYVDVSEHGWVHRQNLVASQ